MDAAVNMNAFALGHAARPHWMLRDDGSFLNHGSYGACPRVVLEEQSRLRAEMERHPDAFMARIHPDKRERAPRRVAECLAEFTGTIASRVALVENATTGVQAVLNSLPFGPGDHILITDHQYNAVRLAVEARCRDTGATPVVVRVPLPTDADAILERVLDAADQRVKLVVLDHITSPTALVFPVERLVPELRRRGIPLLLDGAHSIGQIPLALDALGADWYVTNMHKWLYAPRGSALLHAAAGVVPLTRPVLTSHYIGMGFPHSFDYVGTRDYTAWLSVPRAVAFFRELGAERLWAHQRELIARGSEALQAAGAVPVAPATLSAAMRAFMLPQRRPATDADAATVISTLWEKERIQIRCARIGGTLLLRFCAQAYVEVEEVERLGAALARHGWPERR
jgi:isopenicillin-N epimerase